MNALRRSPILFLTLVLLLGAGTTEAPKPMTAAEVLESEQVIEGLRVPLASLTKGVLNLSFPDAQSRAVFEPEVGVVDLGPRPVGSGEDILELGLERWEWPPSGVEETASSEMSLWTEFLKDVDFFHHFKFYNIRGGFEGDAKTVYDTETGFKGLAQLRSGQLGSLEGELAIRWKQEPGEAEREDSVAWRIAKLETKEFQVTETREPLFTDVSDVALEPDAFSKIATSPRDDIFANMVLAVRTGETASEDMIAALRGQIEGGSYAAVEAHQASVVDIDDDGFDDFYFTSNYGPTLFFRNEGDGTFEEISEELGLAFDNVSSATFADLDNDGDPDAFISYNNSPKGVRYLRNEEGRFVDASSLVEGGLPSWVIPISVTDYNNDGLLDVYLGSYAGAYLSFIQAANARAEREGESSDMRLPWMSEDVSEEMFRRLNAPDAHPLANKPGPPNLLLENQGEGRFRPAANVEAVEIYYNTLGTAWSDFDRDGDMDLYVVNEAGPNQMVRNNGDGTFTDISNEDTAEIGFGMGASVGDYDNDGRADIYTTNMFSKAGMRIAEQMGSSEVIVQSARGNSLLRNGPEGFFKVSGMEPPAPQVEAADFGWGGGFADLNNDGYLDIYVPAGFYSLPQEVATIGDS